MPERCVVARCSSIKDIAKGVSLHAIPYYGDDRPEAKKRRKRWVDFVGQKRAMWTPKKRSVICSEHFVADDFNQRFVNVGEKEVLSNRWLKRDNLGISVFPTIHAPVKEHPPTDRDKRMVRHKLIHLLMSHFCSVNKCVKFLS